MDGDTSCALSVELLRTNESFWGDDLAMYIVLERNFTAYAALARVEVEFSCDMCNSDAVVVVSVIWSRSLLIVVEF